MQTENDGKVFPTNIRVVYFNDFGHRITDKTEETIEDSRGYQFCCQCAGTENEETCDCVKRKERRDGTSEHVMSAGQLDLESICETIMANARKVVEGLREKSFICECPLATDEMANNS